MRHYALRHCRFRLSNKYSSSFQADRISPMTRDWVWARWFLLLIGAFYAAAVLPHVYFRHDDWWILGNSVRHIPGDWGFLVRPTLFFDGREIAWFFRPGFKLFV